MFFVFVLKFLFLYSYENGIPKTIVDLTETWNAFSNCLILEIFAEIDWEYLDISLQNGVVIFICFLTKMFC